jgi:dienelactone hydrolase
MVHTSALTVLLLHGGAWWFGVPVSMDQYRVDLPPQAKVVNLDYTLFDYRRGLAEARAAAAAARRQRRRVLALGFSAGGGYAASLAASRSVDAAVALAPVVDYATWGTPMSWAVVGVVGLDQRRALSPNRLYTRRSAPLRIVHARHDPSAPLAPVRRFAGRWPRVRLRVVPGSEHNMPASAARTTIGNAVRLDLEDLPRRR